MAKILICGYGNIGKHTYKEFEKLKDNIYIYDRYKEEYKDFQDQLYDVGFVCVPTEMLEDGSADTSEIDNIINKIITCCNVIIIKSAIPVGTCEKFNCNNIVCSPEYYGTTQHSLESPGFIVLGGNPDATSAAADIYHLVKPGNFKYIFTDWRTAELAKYMENCWLANKVTFCNEFASIADGYGIDYNQLRECFIADERVNPSHTYVYKDKPYFDSHCLNKDIPALIKMCKDNNIKTPLMDSVLSINNERKQ